MAIHGFPDFQISLDDEVPALNNISAYVTGFSGWDLEELLEEITAASDSGDRHAPVGLQTKAPVTVSGPYDEVANGLVDVTATSKGSIRTLLISFDAAATTIEVECYIKSTSTKPTRGALTIFEVVLQPTGAITLA